MPPRFRGGRSLTARKEFTVKKDLKILAAGNHLLESPVAESFEAPLQNREVVLELGDPVGDGMLGAATARLRGLFGAPTHAEMTAPAPPDLRAEPRRRSSSAKRSW